MLKKLTKEDCDINIKVEIDSLSIRGNVMVSGDNCFDKECEDEIINRVNDGDVWAWAHVTVVAGYNGFFGQASLGGCTYKDQKEFEQDDYYHDLAEEAIKDLNAHINAAYNDLKILDEGYGGSL